MVCQSVSVGVSVFFVMFVSLAKTAEPIRFHLVADSGRPREPLLNGVQGTDNILGFVCPIGKHCESLLWCMQQKINNGISITNATDCIVPD